MVVIGLAVATLLHRLIRATSQVLTWIVVAVFFAVAVIRAVTSMQRRAAFGRRWLATLLVFLVAFLLIGAPVTLFVVPLVRRARDLCDTSRGRLKSEPTVGEEKVPVDAPSAAPEALNGTTAATLPQKGERRA